MKSYGKKQLQGLGGTQDGSQRVQITYRGLQCSAYPGLCLPLWSHFLPLPVLLTKPPSSSSFLFLTQVKLCHRTFAHAVSSAWNTHSPTTHPTHPLILQLPSSLNSALLDPSQRPPSSYLQVPCLKSTSPGILCPLLRFVCVCHTYHDQGGPVRAISTSIRILRYDD